MKKRCSALATVAAVALAGTACVQQPAPGSDRVWAYPMAHEFDFRMIHDDARGFAAAKAHEGFEFRSLGPAADGFEIRRHDVVVMEVERGPSRVVVRMPADALQRAPGVGRLLLNVPRWLEHHALDE